MTPIGIYLYIYLKRMSIFFKIRVRSKIIHLILALCSLSAVILALNIWGIWAMIFAHWFIFALIIELINFVICKLRKRCGIWKRIYRSGIVPIFFTILVLFYGYYCMHDVVKTTYTINTQKNIREEGYRIALISDLHFRTTMNETTLEQYCREIEMEHPDFVVLCGDIVDEQTNLLDLQKVFQTLSTIQSDYGVFYVYGNHDRASYSSKAQFTPQQIKQVLEESGIHILQEESYSIAEDFTIIGREDWYTRDSTITSEQLLTNVDTTDFLLLLDHQPRNLKENAAAGYDLQLSGHTHGGQIWPVGLITDLLGFGEMNYGYRKIDNFQVIVSCGMGGWGYPIRTGYHSEYVIIDIQKDHSVS